VPPPSERDGPTDSRNGSTRRTVDEHAVLLRSEELRTAAIQVDDFSQEEYVSHGARRAPGEAVADVA
jgi:hypothetical protein